MDIRSYADKDAKAVCRIVKKSFLKFVAKEFTEDGRMRFLGEQTPKKQCERAKARFVYVASDKEKIVGMIEATYPDHINRIFVDEMHHGKGIGKKLMKTIESSFHRKGSRKIKVYSSHYAVGFYQSIGYRKTTGIIRRFGFVYQPMMKSLDR